MPLKLTVGLSKKIGLPDYGSIGASCHVEVELDATLAPQDLEGFQRQVRSVYVACAQAVNDELARQGCDNKPKETPAPAATAQPMYSNGAAKTNGNAAQPASDKQHSYASRLAGKIQGLGVRGLESLSRNMFRKDATQMTSSEASKLIDALKAIQEGRLTLDAALNGGQ